MGWGSYKSPAPAPAGVEEDSAARQPGKSFIRKEQSASEMAREIIGENFLSAAFEALNPNVKVLTPAIREVPRSVFRRDVAKVKMRVRSRTFALLDPRTPRMQKWDITIILALLLTSIWAPYEVALIPTEVNTSFFANQVINLIFIIDIIVTFFVPYKDRNQLITSHRKIARRYLRSWFVVDFVSCIPFEYTTFMFSTGSMTGQALKPIKMLRLIRLLKLARIAKASRILTRWENYITIPYSERALIMWSMVLMMMLHWFSCVWCVVAVVHGTLRTPELQASALAANATRPGGCSACFVEPCDTDCLTPCEVELLAALEGSSTSYVLNSESWVCRAVHDGVVGADSLIKRPFEIYMVPLSGMGFIGITYQHGNFTERVVYFALYFMSQVIWSMFVGAICGAIANTDPFTKAYRSAMEQLNHFLRENDAPLEFRLRAREYVRASRDLRKKNAFPQLFAELSPELRNDAAAVCSAATLKSVKVLSDIEHQCIMRLAQLLKYRGTAVGETIMPSGDALYIVTGGVAASGGNILTEGMSFGEDMILSSKLLKTFPTPVIALTYLELAVLSHDELFETLSDYPDSHQSVRIEANKIALRRFGLVLQRAHANKAEQGKAMSDLDVDFLLRTISGRVKLREVDLRRKQILENEKQMLTPRGMWMHSISDRLRRADSHIEAMNAVMMEMRGMMIKMNGGNPSDVPLPTVSSAVSFACNRTATAAASLLAKKMSTGNDQSGGAITASTSGDAGPQGEGARMTLADMANGLDTDEATVIRRINLADVANRAATVEDNLTERAERKAAPLQKSKGQKSRPQRSRVKKAFTAPQDMAQVSRSGDSPPPTLVSTAPQATVANVSPSVDADREELLSKGSPPGDVEDSLNA